MTRRPVYRPRWHLLVAGVLLWAMTGCAVLLAMAPLYRAMDRELVTRETRR